MAADVRGACAVLSEGAAGEGGHSAREGCQAGYPADINMLKSQENKENSIEADDVSKATGDGQNKGDLVSSEMEVAPGLDSPSGETIDGDVINSSDFSSSKKRKHRRRHKGGKNHRHRKWKPYDKLTWDERKNLEDRETKRACMRRETRFASGQAMAPYNTTQFLMEQHEPGEANLHLDESHREHMHRTSVEHRDRTASHHGPDHDTTGPTTQSTSDDGSSEEYCDSGEEVYLEKDFTDAYEQYHSERLQGLSKEELVKEHMDLECEVDSLKNQVKKMESDNRRNSSGSNGGSVSGKSSTLQSPLLSPTEELRTLHLPELKSSNLPAMARLQQEIQKLKEENCNLSLENSRLRRLKELL